MTIGLTGVTGKLGGYVAQVLADAGVETVHFARSPEKAKSYPGATIRRLTYAHTADNVAALEGIALLLMVSAREHPERVAEHQGLVAVAKEAGVTHLVYTSFYGADPEATFTLARDHAATEAYIQAQGLTYTFLRDNFYQDFFLDMCLEAGEIRGPAGQGKVSAVARQDTAAVAAHILLAPEQWVDQTLNLTGPEELTLQAICQRVSQQVGRPMTYYEESVPEAYRSRLKWPADQWEYDAWVSTYTAIAAGEQAGLSLDVERVLGRPALGIETLLKERNQAS